MIQLLFFALQHLLCFYSGYLYPRLFILWKYPAFNGILIHNKCEMYRIGKYSVLLFILSAITIIEGRKKKFKNDVSSLMTTLVNKHYNRLARPNEGHGATQVYFGLSVQDVVSVREGTMEATVAFLVWINVKWVDPRLTWDAAVYDTTSIRLPPQALWVPDIRLYNSLDPHPDMDWGVKVVVSPDGTIHGVIPVVLPVHCGRPSDPHANWDCTLKFASWTYTGDELDLQLMSNDTDISYFNDRVWKITGHTAKRNAILYDCCPETYLDLTYSIRLLRN